jgi:hypothetical protein
MYMKKTKTHKVGALYQLRDYKSPLIAFRYSGKGFTDANPLVLIFRYPEWSAKSTKDKYITGINVKNMNPSSRNSMLRDFKGVTSGGMSYKELQRYLTDPNLSVRTYNTRYVSDCHIVDIDSFIDNN